MKNLSSPLGILVEAEVRSNGDIRSMHKILPYAGEELPSGGLVQAAHALLVEALRAECYVMLLSKLSFGESLESISPKALEEHVSRHLLENFQRLVPHVAEETLKRVKKD